MSDQESDTDDVPTEDREPDDDPGAKGALDKDDPAPGEGTGEGERGLGEQTDALGGAEPTEPEDAEVERAQSSGADS